MNDKELIKYINEKIDNSDFVTNDLLILMLENIGSVNPVLRDETIYTGFCKIYYNNKIDIQQKKFIYNYIINNNLLFKGITKIKTVDVLTRSFTSLLLVLVLEYHYKEKYLTKLEI